MKFKEITARVGLFSSLVMTGSLQAYEIDIDPDRIGVATFNQRLVPIAILGSENSDVRDIRKEGLFFGPLNRGLVLAKSFSTKTVDINGDGWPDRIAYFDGNHITFDLFRNGEANVGRLSGLAMSGKGKNRIPSLFSADDVITPTGEAGGPQDACVNNVSNGVTVGIRCTWTSIPSSGSDFADAYRPIVVSSLLASLGVEASNVRSVVIEAYSGKSKDGDIAVSSSGECYANGGSAGKKGYAATVHSLTSLGDEVWIYAGDSGRDYHYAGASSIVSRVSLNTITEDHISHPGTAGVLAIAGAGGAGADGHCIDPTSYHGGAGGAGGIADATNSTSNVSAAGGNGTDHGGDGGNSSGTGDGGSGHYNGTDGIGGLADQTAIWKGDSYSYDPDSSNYWGYGLGGGSHDRSGGGGGGFGGGGSGHYHHSEHRGGGGGGGSWADLSTLPGAYDPANKRGSGAATSTVILTFDLVVE